MKMRNPVKWLGVLMMLVVMCITTAQSLFIKAEADSCCKKELNGKSPCSDTREKEDCSNEGNPFQFCSCCPHALLPAQAVVFESGAYRAAIVHWSTGMAPVPDNWYAEFWQPPRIAGERFVG